MIQQCTGHRSLKALRTYERTTMEQELAVSKILTSDKKIDYTVSLLSSLRWEPHQHKYLVNLQLSSLATWLLITCLSNCVRYPKASPLFPILHLFLAVLPIVINVNFGQSSSVEFYGKEDIDYQLLEETEKALSSIDINF